MTDQSGKIVDEIRKLEKQLRSELQRRRIDTYEIRDRTIEFRDRAISYHKQRRLHVLVYLRRARLKHVLTAPIIWLCLLPALLMDLVVSLFQAVCFPLYGIPQVRRSDYVVLDRQHLKYLNIIEKMNCIYCGYFTGVLAYVAEVAARTEQYWCPIKHATSLKSIHSRYHLFAEYGDSDQYRDGLDTIRQDFDDLKDESEEAP